MIERNKTRKGLESQLNGGKPELVICKRGRGFEIGTLSNRDPARAPGLQVQL